MTRSALFMLIGFAVAGAPAAASTYTAMPSVPATGRFITRDITWNCGTAACQGATDESRPVVLCESLAKRLGRIDGFIVDGRTLKPAELERCNASARAQPEQPLASK